jgi:ribosomal protein L29
VFIALLTFTTYALAGWMREQVCVYMCPWPRIQAALTDEYALNVTYRYDRGEPRASLRKAAELRELPEDELIVRMESAKEELFNLRFQLATGQLDNPARMKQVRHEVARIATVLREREIEQELDAIADDTSDGVSE